MSFTLTFSIEKDTLGSVSWEGTLHGRDFVRLIVEQRVRVLVPCD